MYPPCSNSRPHPTHPEGNPEANLKSTSHRCYLFEVAFVWEVTKETIDLHLGCLQGGQRAAADGGALNTSPPRSRFTFLRSNCSEIENVAGEASASQGDEAGVGAGVAGEGATPLSLGYGMG